MVVRALALSLAAAVFAVGCRNDDFGKEDPKPTVVKSTYYTQTEDGWTIAVHRYNKSTGTTFSEPVLMSAGFLTSHRIFDPYPRHSLIEELAMNGFDVWAYDIRGTGESQTPEVSFSNIFGWDFGIDDFIQKDTPAVVDFVKEQTGAAKINWVSHSLGSTMMYGYVQRTDATVVNCGVSLGGVGILSREDVMRAGFGKFFFQIGTFMASFIPSNMPLPLKWALDKLLGKDALKWAGLCYALDTFLGKLWWNPDAMNPNLIYQYFQKGLPNTSTNVLKQFLQWAKDNKCVGKDGYDYTANLGKVKIPMCIMSGGGDQMVTMDDCLKVYAKLGSADKQYIECSKRTGHSYDFGHVDMVMGLKARTEVYHHVVEFMAERSTAK